MRTKRFLTLVVIGLMSLGWKMKQGDISSFNDRLGGSREGVRLLNAVFRPSSDSRVVRKPIRVRVLREQDMGKSRAHTQCHKDPIQINLSESQQSRDRALLNYVYELRNSTLCDGFVEAKGAADGMEYAKRILSLEALSNLTRAKIAEQLGIKRKDYVLNFGNPVTASMAYTLANTETGLTEKNTQEVMALLMMHMGKVMGMSALSYYSTVAFDKVRKGSK